MEFLNVRVQEGGKIIKLMREKTTGTPPLTIEATVILTLTQLDAFKLAAHLGHAIVHGDEASFELQEGSE